MKRKAWKMTCEERDKQLREKISTMKTLAVEMWELAQLVYTLPDIDLPTQRMKCKNVLESVNDAASYLGV